MMEMREGFRDMKERIGVNNDKMDAMNEKIEEITKGHIKIEKENKKEFDLIRKEIAD